MDHFCFLFLIQVGTDIEQASSDDARGNDVVVLLISPEMSLESTVTFIGLTPCSLSRRLDRQLPTFNFRMRIADSRLGRPLA